MWIFDILPLWTWLVGTFGIIGIVALIIFAPAVAGAMVAGLLRGIEKIIATRLGLALVVGLACLGGGYLWGSIYVERKCDARIEQLKADAEEARVKRDADIKTAVEKTYGPIVLDMTKRADELAAQVKDYEQKLKDSKSAGAQCVLGADALRLRKRK